MEKEEGGIPLLAFLVFTKVILPCFLHIYVCTKRKISTHFQLPKIYLGTPRYKQYLCRAMHLCSLLIKDRLCPAMFHNSWGPQLVLSNENMSHRIQSKNICVLKDSLLQESEARMCLFVTPSFLGCFLA